MWKPLENWLYNTKYVVVFLRRFQNTMIEDKRLTFKSIERLKENNSKKFIIDVDNPAYSVRNIRLFFVSTDGKKTYSFYGKDQPMNSEEIDLIVANHLIREITRGLMDESRTKIIYLIMGGIIGLLIGLFVMNLVMQNKIKGLYEDWIASQPTLIGVLRLCLQLK